VAAVGQLLTNGINVNITLLFPLRNYGRVMEAYLAALETRVAIGKRQVEAKAWLCSPGHTRR
jgi:transaldolase